LPACLASARSRLVAVSASFLALSAEPFSSEGARSAFRLAATAFASCSRFCRPSVAGGCPSGAVRAGVACGEPANVQMRCPPALTRRSFRRGRESGQRGQRPLAACAGGQVRFGHCQSVPFQPAVRPGGERFGVEARSGCVAFGRRLRLLPQQLVQSAVSVAFRSHGVPSSPKERSSADFLRS
jgi:hypothetical protein